MFEKTTNASNPEAALPREKSKGFVLFKEVAGAWIKMPKNKVLPSRTVGAGLLSLHSCINSLSAEKEVANESPCRTPKAITSLRIHTDVCIASLWKAFI